MTRFDLIRAAIEVAVALVICGVMWRVADADNRSPILWTVITVAVCIASVAMPLPLVRLILAGGLVFSAMFVTNLIRLPPL